MAKAEQVVNCMHAFRVKKGVTQEELAAALDVTRQTVIAIEKGNYAPSVALALKIAKFFKTSVEDIFSIK
jgi:putative transcriptional regulator